MKVDQKIVFGDVASEKYIPVELSLLIDEVKGAALHVFEENLHSVYVTGSAVRGDWRGGVSDLDMMAITRSEATKARLNKFSKIVDGLAAEQQCGRRVFHLPP